MSCSRRFHLVSQAVRQRKTFNQALKTHSPKRTSDETQHQLLLPDGRGNALLQAPLVEHPFFSFEVSFVDIRSAFSSSSQYRELLFSRGSNRTEGGGGSALMINGGGESQVAGLPKIDGDKLGNQTGIGLPPLPAACEKNRRIKRRKAF